jgi:lipopolysaccharide/colanic/teichoic acid biosynthesis glycosyltransferase
MLFSDAEVGEARLYGAYRISSGDRRLYWRAKRWCDLVFAALLAPIMLAVAAALSLLNPFLNPGPIFFTQRRMGRDGVVFRIVKFRTMREIGEIERGPGDPVEIDRITVLGGLLRRLRIDEIPQIINVLRGEMSLIGPRPDYIDHALCYSKQVPGYRLRHCVRPGITGYAQVRLGYVETLGSVEHKTKLDLYYIMNACWRLDLAIFLRTLLVIISGFGSR